MYILKHGKINEHNKEQHRVSRPSVEFVYNLQNNREKWVKIIMPKAP